MMDSDRPHHQHHHHHHHHHRTGSTSSELFICFTSRLSSSSSSSMKISSKSVPSPGRSRDQQPPPPPQQQQQQSASLSNSLSRRLRTNGSMRGGQASPMFPTGAAGKKRGSGFENPEPSSPKVTCIGQVRVKTKKQGKKMRTLSKRRRGGGGEVSFRKVDLSREGASQQECLNQRNQRWVHLPLMICEALRAFGAEFSCLFPCRSSCSSTTDEREEKAGGGREGEGRSSCGAVFARWLVAVQDGEGGKQREIELVVGGGEEEEEEVVPKQSSGFSRHATVRDENEFEGDEKWEVNNDGEEEEEEEEGRAVSICIPPKNALLLMRCRSDPVKMSALANRFWEPPICNEEDEDDDDGGDGHEDEGKEGNVEDGDEGKEGNVEEGDVKCESSLEDKGFEVFNVLISNEVVDVEEKLETEAPEAETKVLMEVQEEEEEENPEEDEEEKAFEICEEEELGIEEREEKEVEEIITQKILEDLEAIVDLEKLENEEEDEELIQLEQEEEEEERRESHCSAVDSEVVHSDLGVEEGGKALTVTLTEAALEEESEKSTTEADETQEKRLLQDHEGIVTLEKFQDSITQENNNEEEEEELLHLESEEREESATEEVKKEERESPTTSVLPDCLLLMMCEPKLSMEVSKETWVCSTDFIRWLPDRQVKKTDGGSDHPKKERVVGAVHSNPAHLQQPHRSSCSFPAAAASGVSMASMIEQKFVSAGAYEPFGLTRCKSEPMRTAAAKLAVPEACFWKNRKMEPHRRSTFGIGAAGVGF